MHFFKTFFYKIKATSNLGFNSTTGRKKERLEEAMGAYKSLMNAYPDTKYTKEAESIFKKMEKELKVAPVTSK